MNNQFPCYQSPKKDIVDILLFEWEAAKIDTPYGQPAFKDGADEIARLREENERLLGLLEMCQPYVEQGYEHSEFECKYGSFEFHEKVCGLIEKELGQDD